MKSTHCILVLALGGAAFAQEPAQEPAPEQATTEKKRTFDDASSSVQTELEASLKELDELRKQMADETIPLSGKLRELEGELLDVRLQYQDTTRLLDGRTLDLTNLRTKNKGRREELTYLSNLLTEYVRNFESRLHIAELHRYEKELESARLAPENKELSEREILELQATLLAVSLDRLEDALGGTQFAGTAVDPEGLVKEGTFVLVGPAAIFTSSDGQKVGTAEQILGSLEPNEVEFEEPEDALAAAALARSSTGSFPLDPTLGNAHKIAETEQSQLEEIQAGGAVMYPIFAMAGLALLIAIFKWLSMAFIRKPSRKKVNALLEAVGDEDEEAARKAVRRIRGPVGRMLAAGVAHIREPRDLIEEVMYETVLTTRLRLQKLLPFIAISAASAPLLGLLGTVTGIINTFKMITVFGSGDVKALSGGISEALITTKFGLIVAIPSLLIHAFLSRKARSVIGQMETAAVAFVNAVSRTSFGPSGKGHTYELPRAAAPDPALVREQVSAILKDLLEPVMDEHAQDGAVSAGAGKKA